MGVPGSAFQAGDVYIDFPYEEVMFRYEKGTGKVFRKFYGKTREDEIPAESNLYAEGIIAGTQTTLDEYRRGRPRRNSS
jgi:hypothetical protein